MANIRKSREQNKFIYSAEAHLLICDEVKYTVNRYIQRSIGIVKGIVSKSVPNSTLNFFWIIRTGISGDSPFQFDFHFQISSVGA